MVPIPAGLAIACLSALGLAVAAGQTPPSASRGELLYATHCRSCHEAQVHWRDRRLAKDWASLAAQVRRWQANAGLGWSDQEVLDVARYLNARYYRFAPPARQAHGREPGRAAAPAL